MIVRLTPLFLLPALALAQVPAPNDAGVAMGHLHLTARDVEAQRRFWTAVLGARQTKLGSMEAYLLPGAVVLVKKGEPTGGTDGSVVNHCGVKVRDLSSALERVESGGFRVLSRNPRQAMVEGPDAVRIELTEDKALATAVANHHIHFYTPDVDATKTWYVNTFGAAPGRRGQFEAADLPGVNLTFSKADRNLVGTKGRSLDHIGFEVHGLEAFAKRLEGNGVHFDVPYRSIPAIGLAIAFFTDPWGTYIELTEGLSALQ